MSGERRNALPNGYLFEGYRIDGVLGAGGFGVTYRATEVALDRTVAIKEFLPAAARPAWTAGAPLPGGDFPPDGYDEQVAVLHREHHYLDLPLTRRLVRAYGTQAHRLLRGARSMADLGQHFGAGLTEREVDYLMEREWALSADDVLWRRSKLGLRLAPRGQRGRPLGCARQVEQLHALEDHRAVHDPRHDGPDLTRAHRAAIGAPRDGRENRPGARLELRLRRRPAGEDLLAAGALLARLGAVRPADLDRLDGDVAAALLVRTGLLDVTRDWLGERRPALENASNALTLAACYGATVQVFNVCFSVKPEPLIPSG